MNVVIVDTLLTSPPAGGPHIFLSRLAKALQAQDFHITVISQPGKDHSCVEQMVEDDVKVYLDKWGSTELPEERAHHLADWVNHERPDIYLVFNSTDTGWLALPLLNRSIATMAIAHNDVEAYYAPLRHYGEFVDCAVGVSRQITEDIVRVSNFPAERVSYVPYGVPILSQREFELDQARRSAQTNPLRLVYLGRIVQTQKRVLDLAPIAFELAKRNVDFELNLIGEGQEKSGLVEAFQKSGVDNRVHFRGWLDSVHVRQCLRELDVLLLLSDYEGLPIAMLEAMGHGVVPVVTDVKSGMTEVISNDVNGYVVPVGNTSAFAAQVQALDADRAKLIRMGRAAWSSAQEFSIERMAQDYISHFTRIAEKRRMEQPRVSTPTDFPLMHSCRSRYPYWLRKIKQHGLAVRDRLFGSPTGSSEIV